MILTFRYWFLYPVISLNLLMCSNSFDYHSSVVNFEILMPPDLLFLVFLFPCDFFKKINFFIWKLGIDREIIHLLILLHPVLGQAKAWCKSSIWSSHTGDRDPGIPACSRLLRGSWIGHGATGSQTGIHMRYQCHWHCDMTLQCQSLRMNSKIFFLQFCEECDWKFSGDCSKSVDCFGLCIISPHYNRKCELANILKRNGIFDSQLWRLNNQAI